MKDLSGREKGGDIFMKKLLLLGGSHAEIPLIKAAQKMGYYVITTGNQKDGLGHPYADDYIECDFSDKDAICKLAKEQQVDAICSGCNDFAYLSTAYACEKLGLPGHDSYETALELHHKNRYRSLAERLEIATPKACQCKNIEEIRQAAKKMQFPVIVKPIDLTGGKGMMRCDTQEQLEQAYTQAARMTREPYVLIEEFLTGSNHGFSAYIQNQKVSFFFADNEQYYHNPYLVSGASTPGDIPAEALQQLCADSEKIARHLQLTDGILHIQFILKEEKTPVIIEICRRAPGDLYIHLVELANGIDYPAYIVGGEVGKTLPAPVYHDADGYYVRHCIMADKEGIVKNVIIADEIAPYIIERMLWYRQGEKIEDMLKYKAGIVFLHFQEEKEYRRYLEKLTSLICIEVGEAEPQCDS
jgi:biotin carboxylase